MRRGAMEAFETLSRLPNKHERYVFIDPTNGEPWQDTDRLRLRFRALCAKAGVRYRNPYQTRHTFASTLLASGKPSFYVQTQMGHSSLKMIEERYARWIDQGRSKQSRMKLDAFFSLDDDVDAIDN
jgi:integrase